MFTPVEHEIRGWPGRIEGDRVIQLAAQTLESFFTGGGHAREHAKFIFHQNRDSVSHKSRLTGARKLATRTRMVKLQFQASDVHKLLMDQRVSTVLPLLAAGSRNSGPLG